MGVHLGDLVAVDAAGHIGVIIGRTATGWIVEMGDDELVIAPTVYKVVAA